MNKFKLCAFADEAGELLTQQIDAMQCCKIEYLEMRGIDGKNVSELTVSEAKDVKSKLDSAGLSVWSIGSPTGKIKISDDFKPHVETFKKLLETASIVDATRFRMFSFYGTDGKVEYKAEVVERLSRLCELAAPYGIVLCHENEKGIYGDTPERCLEIMSEVAGLKAVFDPANFVQCGIDTAEAWSVLESYIDYIHIKDSKLDGSIVPAGLGHGKIPLILKNYKKIGGEVVTLEPHLWEFSGLAALEEEGDKSDVGGLGYTNQRSAFDAGVNALKEILKNI